MSEGGRERGREGGKEVYPVVGVVCVWGRGYLRGARGCVR